MTTLQEENIEGYAGDTISIDLQLLDSDDELLPAITTTGASATLEVRSRLFGDLLFSVGGVVTPATSAITFTIPASDTLTLLEDGARQVVLVYGAQVIFSDASKLTLVTGKLKIVRGVLS